MYKTKRDYLLYSLFSCPWGGREVAQRNPEGGEADDREATRNEQAGPVHNQEKKMVSKAVAKAELHA